MSTLFARSHVLPFLLVTSCGGSPCSSGFVGDPKLAPEAIMVMTDGISQQLDEVGDGTKVPLEPPPQGGYVMYLAAKVRNMDGCGLQFAGRLRDPKSGNQVGFDARTTNLIVGADGWGYPNATNNANLSNVNGCPDYSAVDVQGNQLSLEMNVRDRGGRELTVSHTIVPTCALSPASVQADCVCSCAANYELGKCSMLATDAGHID